MANEVDRKWGPILDRQRQRDAIDDRFFPCNKREAEILATLRGDKLLLYKGLRHEGKTVMEALELTDASLHQKMVEQERAQS